MPPTDDERSEAFLREYYALCKKHGVQIEQVRIDDFRAAPQRTVDGDGNAINIMSQREWDERNKLYERGQLKTRILCALSTWWWWGRRDRHIDELATGLCQTQPEPEPDRALLEELVEELRAEHPELFGERDKP